jgi:hypothetical protein
MSLKAFQKCDSANLQIRTTEIKYDDHIPRYNTDTYDSQIHETFLGKGTHGYWYAQRYRTGVHGSNYAVTKEKMHK